MTAGPNAISAFYKLNHVLLFVLFVWLWNLKKKHESYDMQG